MKKILMLAMGGVFFHASGFGQSEVDALRYSQLNFRGTSRSAAMGGAFGALGGDFSSLSINPAGIAIYRRSEVMFSPGFFTQKTTSSLDGNQLDNYKYNVNLSNAGMVLSYYEEETTKAWKGISFGFGYNRTNNFNQRISMLGRNPNNSMLDVFLADASGVEIEEDLDPFGSRLAYDTYAIWYDTTTKQFYHHLQGIYGQEQSKEVTSSGSMGETVFSLGANYDDKLYMGFTIGIPNIKYFEETNYSEKADTALNFFKGFDLNQSLRTTGAGFNFKFGMIFRPADFVRIGGAFHSGSYFSMHDEWSSDMKTYFENPTEEFTAKSPSGSFDYTLVTPMRAVGSLGFIIQKKGLVGIDYEFVDYPAASLSSSRYKYLNENKAIREKYMEGNIVRFGTEWRLEPMSIRAGAAYHTSPFKGSKGNMGIRMDYTAGIGFRADENFYLDLAYVHSTYSENYFFYGSNDLAPSKNSSSSSSMMMTLGFKF